MINHRARAAAALLLTASPTALVWADDTPRPAPAAA